MTAATARQPPLRVDWRHRSVSIEQHRYDLPRRVQQFLKRQSCGICGAIRAVGCRASARFRRPCAPSPLWVQWPPNRDLRRTRIAVRRCRRYLHTRTSASGTPAWVLVQSRSCRRRYAPCCRGCRAFATAARERGPMVSLQRRAGAGLLLKARPTCGEFSWSWQSQFRWSALRRVPIR